MASTAEELEGQARQLQTTMEFFTVHETDLARPLHTDFTPRPVVGDHSAENEELGITTVEGEFEEL